MSSDNGYADTSILLEPFERSYTDLEVPSYGKFQLSTMSELDRSEIEYEVARKQDMKGRDAAVRQGAYIKGLLIAKSVCDGQGRLAYTRQQAEVIAEGNSALVNALVDGIQRHCGWTDEDLESMAKNSEGGPAGDSP